MKIRLSKIADSIFTGLSTSGRSPVGKGGQAFPIINVKDLIDGEIDLSDLNTVIVEDFEKIQRYSLKADDVLITIRGTLLKLAVVPKELAGYLVSSNLAVIRLPENSPISPILLQTYLESQIGQQDVFSRSRRTTLQLALSCRDVGDIEVPIPDLEKQRTLEALVIATKEYMKFGRMALEARTRVSNQLFSEAFLQV